MEVDQMQVTVNSTSADTAEGEDIVLRETKTTRLLFRPMIVNNDQNEEASVRGWFLFQRKRPGDLWEDYQEYDATKLKADEFFKLEIKAEEMLTLMTELDMYYKIYKDYGIQWGYNTYSKKDILSERIVAILKEDDLLLDAILDDDKNQLLTKTLRWIGSTKNSDQIIAKLLEIQADELDHLNNVVGIVNLKKLLAIWDENRNNNNEQFWQKTFNKNAWVLSQIFASPFLDFQQEAYVGGKTIENREGKIVDFIYQNDLSKEVALIEIKTPNTNLLSGEYRTGVYSVHSDLTGSVVQVLGYREQIKREFAQLRVDYDREFNVFNPQCVVIAGKLDGLGRNQIQSFEIYRQEMKNVMIITYDELFKKVQLLLDLLAEKEEVNQVIS